MTSRTLSRRDRIISGEHRAPSDLRRTPRLIALAAALVLAATTGLPVKSVAHLIPQADDQPDPFIGI